MTTEEKIKVMQAYLEGKTIEAAFHPSPNIGPDDPSLVWETSFNPTWSWNDTYYRIKDEKQPAKTLMEYVKETGNGEWVNNTIYGTIVDYIDKYVAKEIDDLRRNNMELQREIENLKERVDSIPQTVISPYIPCQPFTGTPDDIPYGYPKVWYCSTNPKKTNE